VVGDALLKKFHGEKVPFDAEKNFWAIKTIDKTMKKISDWALAAARPLVLTMVFCGTMVLMSCSNDENPPEPQEYSGVPLVILDTDIGSSADDLFALEMLYRYEDEGRCRLLGVVVDREGERNAAFADVMNTYFGHGDVPVGLVRDGIKEPKVWIDYVHVADTKDGEGLPMFRRTVADYSSLPDGRRLYRRLLAAQPDHSVSIVSVGFVTCLAQLLTSGADEYSSLTGVELVRRKVKCIYLQGGVFGEAEEPDFNFAQGITFAKTFFQLWGLYAVRLQHRSAHVGCDARHTGRGGRCPLLALPSRHRDAHRQGRDHLYALGHGQLPLPAAWFCRLERRDAGENQTI